MQGLKVSELKAGQYYYCPLLNQEVLMLSNGKFYYYNESLGGYNNSSPQDGQLLPSMLTIVCDTDIPNCNN